MVLRLLRVCLSVAVLGAPALAQSQVQPDTQPAFTARGHDNPTLAFNTGSAADFVPGMQFLDIAKTMRAWIGHKPGQWGGMRYAELREGGYIDEKGWVREIPPGLSHVGTLWQWSKHPEAAAHRIGRYILRYEGEGRLSLGGDAHILQRAPGVILFENRAGQTMYLSLRDSYRAASGT